MKKKKTEMNKEQNEVMAGEQTIETVQEPKPYTLRRLMAKDIAPMATILKRIGMKEIRSCFDGDTTRKLIAEDVNGKGSAPENNVVKEIGMSVAFDMADIILGKLPVCQESINALLADMSGMEKKDIEELPLGTYTEMIIDVLRQDGFRDFLKAVRKFAR